MHKLIVALLLTVGSMSALAQDVGAITGTVVDKQTGDFMIGASIQMEGTTNVAFVDVNGKYRFTRVPVGTYTLVALLDGFNKTTVTEVVVKKGEATKIDMEMTAAAFETEITVTADILEDNELGLLRFREKSIAIADAISAETITRAGGSTAADAVTKVTGASVVGGKYVYIRGLGDRYTSTQVNGVEMPSSDPDKNSFQVDLFPTSVLENIVTVKSFTPDKPGNFSGGIMDIGTKNYPTNFEWNVGISGSYNTEVTGNDNYLYYEGSDTDWLGYDDGLRELPEGFDDPDFTTPSLITARRNQEQAEFLDRVTKSFVPVMGHQTRSAPENKGMNFSVGNAFNVLGKEVGVFGSFTYKRDYSFRENLEQNRWELTDVPDSASTLSNLSDFEGNRGEESASWGGLLTASLKLNPTNQLRANFLYTQTGDSQSEFYSGRWPAQFSSDNAFLESRLLKYTERNLNTFQLEGTHFMPDWGDVEIGWVLSTSDTSQYEPDTRIFTNTRSERIINGEMVDIYSITLSTYQAPARYWRELDETQDSFKADVTVPFSGANLSGKFKFGVSLQDKDREFRETRFEYDWESNTRYDGNPESWFGPENTGILGFDERTGRYIFGTVLISALDAQGGNYNGTQSVDAFYAMMELNVTENLRLIAGGRNEKADFEVSNEDEVGTLDDNDFLPALHFIYTTGPRSNVRLAYGETLARPTFREKAPYASFDFIADGIYLGNPDLERTLISNYDFRWEWYVGPGELLAASAFHKEFENPIEKAFSVRAEFGETSFINVDEATVSGIELEARKRLSPADSVSQFSIAGNISFIESEVNIPPEELELLRRIDPDADDTRELQGQSPYLVNVGLNYDHFDRGIAASLLYNVFGERLDEVGFGGVPNAFEQPRHQVDFTYTQTFGVRKNLKFKFSAKNLLDEPFEVTQDFKGTSFVRSFYDLGSSYSVSLSYKP